MRSPCLVVYAVVLSGGLVRLPWPGVHPPLTLLDVVRHPKGLVVAPSVAVALGSAVCGKGRLIDLLPGTWSYVSR